MKKASNGIGDTVGHGTELSRAVVLMELQRNADIII